MQKFIKFALLGLLGFFALLLVWGLVEPYFFDVHAETVAIPNLPASWQGQRVAIISDFQVGMWLDNLPTVRRIVDRIIQERPAAVIILGDFIYHGGKDASLRIQKASELVRPIMENGIPVYAVLGNHDYSVVSSKQPDIDYQRARNMGQALASFGVHMLQNETLSLQTPGSGSGSQKALLLVGVGSHMPGLDDPARALSGLSNDAPRLVAMHNPDSFEDIAPGQAPVAVAGHTHGGQIRLPFTPNWTWLTFLEEDEIHADGWIKDYGQPGNRLYVNRGIGFSKLPLRINCPPELTLFTLTRPES